VGRLDTLTASELESELKELLPELTELNLNFKKLEYISSAGLRVLLVLQKGVANGAMTIYNVNDQIAEVFDITGFIDILTVK
jgi:anti-sigma B factor antagonist